MGENNNPTITWLSNFEQTKYTFDNSTYGKFHSEFIKNVGNIVIVTKNNLITALIKLEQSALCSLRLDLNKHFLGIVDPKIGEVLKIKNKTNLTNIANDIYVLTHFIVDYASLTIEKVVKGNVHNMKSISSGSNEIIIEQFESLFDNISEVKFYLDESDSKNIRAIQALKESNDALITENKNLKLIIENLNNKVSTLEINVNKILQAVSSKSTPNNNLFNAPANTSTNGAPLFSAVINKTINTDDTPKRSLKRNSEHLGSAPTGSKKQIISRNDKNNNNNNNNKNNNTNNNKSKLTLKDFDSSNPHAPNKNINSNPWQETRQDKLKKKQETKSSKSSFNNYAKAVGTGSFEGLNSVERPITVRIKRVANDVDPIKIETFLKDVVKIRYNQFKEMTLSHQHFKAYTFSISFLQKSIIDEKTAWPAGWEVSRFFHRKPSTILLETNANGPSGSTNSASNSSEMTVT